MYITSRAKKNIFLKSLLMLTSNLRMTGYSLLDLIRKEAAQRIYNTLSKTISFSPVLK